jgi:hypothetical protein
VEWRQNPNVEKDKMQRYLGQFTFLMTVVLELSSILVLTHYVIFPDSNIHLLLTWMPSWLRNHWITFILYGSLWVWLVMALYSIIAFILITVASYGSFIVPIVCKELVRDKVKGYKTKGLLRLLPKHLTMEYRKIEVIQLNVNEQLGVTLISLEALIGETVVFSNFALLTMWEELDGITAAVFVFVALGVTICWVGFLEGFGMFHKRGQELLESWRLATWSSKMDRIWVGKFAKSCRPLAMRSKEHFCVKRLSSLRFLQGVVVGTLSLVLAKSVKK